jgi:transposase InsO family protein
VGTAPGTGEKRGPTGVNRTAEEPDQTVNVDLCCVPAVHEADHKVPAVRGSSGRLVVERPVGDTPEQTWPGRIFDDPEVAYADAMRAFVATAPAPARPRAPAGAPDLQESPDRGRAPREVRRAGRAQEATLRAQRRQVRAQRTADAAAWRAPRAEQRTAPVPPCGAPPRLQPPASPAPSAPDTPHARAALGQQQRTQRRAVRAQRHQEDALWRQQRHSLRAQLPVPLLTAWIAILVITDNCTRRCLGVPLFVAGPKITAEIVVAALRVLLPPELQFLIADRGVHFTAQVFAHLAAEQHFLHVLIARHRPASNGIAERFVRTLKEWLADKTWDSAADLGALLARFLAEYNARPHQGLAIPGLSPTEFAQRIWLL